MTRASILLKTIVISSALWLSACTIFPEETPQTRYNLPAATMQPVGTQKSSTLYVATPQANRLINSNYILVQPEGTEIQSYKGSQWADVAPILIRDRLILALNDAKLFEAVSSDGALNTPWALEGYLSHFEVKYLDAQPVVRVQYEGQIIDRKQATIVRNKRFTITQPAASTDITAIITAFGNAGDTLSLQVLEWLNQ